MSESIKWQKKDVNGVALECRSNSKPESIQVMEENGWVRAHKKRGPKPKVAKED